MKAITIKGTCVVTGKPHKVTVPRDGYLRWKKGGLIQKAMPEVSEDDREFLISGISPEGWKQIFG